MGIIWNYKRLYWVFKKNFINLEINWKLGLLSGGSDSLNGGLLFKQVFGIVWFFVHHFSYSNKFVFYVVKNISCH